jgi:hypothetical protein
MHNSTIYRTLANDSSYAGVLDKARSLADEEAWYSYGDTSSSVTNNQAIAGKTIASSILNTFEMLIADQSSPGDKTDMSYPLTFLFSEPEPMISLISLLMADHNAEYFRSIPPFASAIIFELFSTGANNTFPISQDDLWVRFYFHNGTEFNDDQLTAFPIFGNGPSKTGLQWKEFKTLFNRVRIATLQDWCDTCVSPALFCSGTDEDGNNISFNLPAAKKQKHNKISPVVGGIIGALVTLAVAGLLFGLAMLLAGVRFHRVQRKKKSELGGFKGSAKLASDLDLSLAKNGAPPAGISFGPDTKRGHERVGSWELRQKEYGGDLSECERRESFDAINAVTSKPVQPRESV